MRQYSALTYESATRALERVFKSEFAILPHEESKLVLRDFVEAHEEDGLSAETYRKSIGVGNLVSYAATMKARFNKGW